MKIRTGRESHLLQMRGLKPFEKIYIGCSTTVASFTDAWIETHRDTYPIGAIIVASFTDAWIETEINDINEHVNLVASFTDAWIETFLIKLDLWILRSHLLQMRGLKP